jgi:CheY-like chemotaxis protein
VELATITVAEDPLPQSDPAAGNCDAARQLRILVVDDHVDTLKVLRRILEGSGHCVTSASSVKEATLAAQSATFDLIISDIGLPDGSGLDIVRSVRVRDPHVPAIAMTGFGMEQDIRSSEEAGFWTHLTKPVDMNSLERAIGELTRGVAEV